MRTLFIAIFTCAIFLQANAQEPQMKPIFNGNNLDGWVVPENNIWWTVNENVLSAKSDPEKKGSVLWTRSK
jgi:hypothetical protein